MKTGGLAASKNVMWEVYVPRSNDSRVSMLTGNPWGHVFGVERGSFWTGGIAGGPVPPQWRLLAFKLKLVRSVNRTGCLAYRVFDLRRI